MVVNTLKSPKVLEFYVGFTKTFEEHARQIFHPYRHILSFFNVGYISKKAFVPSNVCKF
jgi:hypothetical protein